MMFERLAMRVLFLGAAVLLFVIAITMARNGVGSEYKTQAGLPSLGFAVAGGLALLAAAVVRTDK